MCITRCMRKRVLGAAITIATALVCASHLRAQTASRKPAAKSTLTIEQLIDTTHPADPVWSPDGKHLAFIWDRAYIRNLYVANTDRSGPPVALRSFPERELAHPFSSD